MSQIGYIFFSPPHAPPPDEGDGVKVRLGKESGGRCVGGREEGRKVAQDSKEGHGWVSRGFRRAKLILGLWVVDLGRREDDLGSSGWLRKRFQGGAKAGGGGGAIKGMS